MIYKSATELIGNTPLLEAVNIEKSETLQAKVLFKLEYLNPAGSIKDRAAKAMIDDAEAKGLLKEGSVIIEPTSGNTGIGLAAIAIPKGYRVILTMPETMSIERRNILKAYGAEIVLTDGSKGMSGAIEKAEAIAKAITDALGGYGIFGVELFIKGDGVIFSEVSPRPHDTGMVTMISQDMSEFGLHARAILGLPIPDVKFYGPSASKAIVIEGNTKAYEFCNLEKVLEEPGVQIRFFGKPEVAGHRRVGVILATDESVAAALAKAERAYNKLEVKIK